MLMKTISKGAFAYNTLFLRLPPLGKNAVATRLADITCLAILFGDEFIDGICVATGKEYIRDVVKKQPEIFYLKAGCETGKTCLRYNFNIEEIIPAPILDLKNEKYQLSYRDFNSLLLLLQDHMNSLITQLPANKREAAAEQIAEVCNTCIDTYLHDIHYPPVQDLDADLAVLLSFHDAKNRKIQQKLLQLRCLLADRPELMHLKEAEGWLEIISIMQFYDDMLDAGGDDGFQDNLLLCIAKKYFPGELDWFRSHYASCTVSPQMVALHMPATIQYCYRLIAGKMQCMNWEQKKIANYLLFKDWFSSGDEKSMDLSSGMDSLKSIFNRFWQQMPHLTEQQVKAYVINTCFLWKPARRMLKKQLAYSDYYQLRYDLLSIEEHFKSRIFDQLTKTKVIKAF